MAKVTYSSWLQDKPRTFTP